MIGATHPAHDERAGARILDRAEGVLIGLQRCRAEAAFDEIVSASRQHLVPALRVAQALVEIAECRELTDPDAANVVRRQWGDLLDMAETR